MSGTRLRVVCVCLIASALARCGRGEHAPTSLGEPPMGSQGGQMAIGGAKGLTAKSGSGGASGAVQHSGAASGRGPEIWSGEGGAAEGGKDGTGGASAGSAGTVGMPEINLCLRLARVEALTREVVTSYEVRVYADCRLKWVVNLYLPNGRADFQNRLNQWTYRLWGCATPPPDDFALIDRVVPISEVEAEALIDRYLEAVTIVVQLSAEETASLRGALQKLSAPLIDPTRLGFPESSCALGGGGGAAGISAAAGDSGAAGAWQEATLAGGSGGTAP